MTFVLYHRYASHYDCSHHFNDDSHRPYNIGHSSTITFTTESSSKLFTIETSTPINQILSVPSFQTMRLPINFDIVAHTGSLVRNLLITVGSSMA
ncbi:unnamed protein product [Rotaria sp. Silwood1]|nr:unnamed protein product [Rotaria sp. Silwood1]CAF4544779.1 unnamed protein product [Rotaria sp. Silwood1]